MKKPFDGGVVKLILFVVSIGSQKILNNKLRRWSEYKLDKL